MGNNLDKISIIMGVYNCAGTLPNAIDSILAQTYDNWELIMCDDASTDSTLQVAEMYRERFPEKIKIIKHETNMFLAQSLNDCIAASSGEFIARMDGDDLSLPNRLEKQVQYLNEHPDIAVVGTGMIRFDENGDYAKVAPAVSPGKQSLKMDVPHFHATIMMKKSVYDDVGGYTVLPRTQRGQDVDLWFKVYAKGYKGANLPDYLYRVREDKAAFHRRKLKYDLYVMLTRFHGYELIQAKPTWYLYAVLPVIGHFVPRKLKIMRRNLMTRKIEKGKEI